MNENIMKATTAVLLELADMLRTLQEQVADLQRRSEEQAKQRRENDARVNELIAKTEDFMALTGELHTGEYNYLSAEIASIKAAMQGQLQ